MSKIVQLDNKDVSKIFLPLKNKDKLDIRSIKPYRDAVNTKEDMEQFLEKQHPSGQMFGFEMNYLEDETNFNIITEKYKNEQTVRRFSSFNEENGVIEAAESTFIPIEDKQYMSVYDFKFTEDYWKPIPFHNEVGERDPLDELLTEMAGRDHNLKFKFQVLAKPMHRSRWTKRHPLPWLLALFIPNTETLKNPFSGIWSTTKKTIKKPQRNFTDFVMKSLKIGVFLAFLPFMLILLGLLNLPNMIAGLNTDTYIEKLVDDPEVETKIRDKVDQEGYMTQVRLIVVGDNPENVEHYANETVTRIEQLYTNTNYENPLNQGLLRKQKNDKNWLMTEAAYMVDREAGVDFNGRFTDQEPFYYLKNSRRDPTIMTPKELASLMHYIEDSTHPSINWGNR